MSETMTLRNFKNDLFGDVRVFVDQDGVVLFCGVDVAKALGYKNASNALSDHCRCIAKRYAPHPQSPSKQIEMSFIPESDVFRLVFGSKLPEAERFTDWITKEVIPHVLRNGYYAREDLQVIPYSADSMELVVQSPEMYQLRAERQMIEKDRQILDLDRKCYELQKTVDKQASDIAELERRIDADVDDDRDKPEFMLRNPSIDKIQGGYKPHGKLTARAIRELYRTRISVACADDKDGLATTTIIAKDYGMTVREFNKLLCGLKYQDYDKDTECWIPAPKYFGLPEDTKCYVIKTYGAKRTTYWTAYGWEMLFTYLKNDIFRLPDAWQTIIEDTVLPILANRYRADPKKDDK